MSSPFSGLTSAARRDPRYAFEAYEFVLEALSYTQESLGRVPPTGPAAESRAGTTSRYHVSGRELLLGVRDYARRQFGLLARSVFRAWGVNATEDFGEIIFNMIDIGLLSKNDTDRREDFRAVYDMDRDLLEGYEIPAGPAVTSRRGA